MAPRRQPSEHGHTPTSGQNAHLPSTIRPQDTTPYAVWVHVRHASTANAPESHTNLQHKTSHNPATQSPETQWDHFPTCASGRATHRHIHLTPHVHRIRHTTQNRRQTGTVLLTTLNHIMQHTQRRMHRLHSDNAKEYLSKNTTNFLIAARISHTTTVPYTPQSNPIAERLNRTLMNAILAAFSHSCLPASFWYHAVACATFKYNHTPHAVTAGTPAQKWNPTSRAPTHLLPFGTLGTIPNLRPN